MTTLRIAASDMSKLQRTPTTITYLRVLIKKSKMKLWNINKQKKWSQVSNLNVLSTVSSFFNFFFILITYILKIHLYFLHQKTTENVCLMSVTPLNLEHYNVY